MYICQKIKINKGNLRRRVLLGMIAPNFSASQDGTQPPATPRSGFFDGEKTVNPWQLEDVVILFNETNLVL